MNISITSIHDRAMLVYLRIQSWSARKLDTKATKDLTKDKGATSDAARVNKHLLAASDEKLRAIQKIGDEARKYIDANTLPWDDAGNRLLSNSKSIGVVTELTNIEKRYIAAVDEFLQDYPNLRTQALANLGDLANESDYPHADQLRSKFSFRLSFSPVPTSFGDDRTGLQPEQVKALEAHYQANASRQVGDALMSAWSRLRENLQHYSDRLREKDDGSGKMQIFRDSMVENLRETCALLRDLNVFDDEGLDRMRLRVERDIAGFDADDLRDNRGLSFAVRAEVDLVLDHMKQMLGE